MTKNNLTLILLAIVITLAITFPAFGVFIGFSLVSVFLLEWWRSVTFQKLDWPTYEEEEVFDYTIAPYEVRTDEAKLANFLMRKRSYMTSQHWEKKRKEVLFKYGSTCQGCGSRNRSILEIHHLAGYNKIPNESLDFLVPLCRSCHQTWHNKHGYPETYNDYMQWNHSFDTITELKYTIHH